MKKLLSALLSAAIILSSAGCGENTSENSVGKLEDRVRMAVSDFTCDDQIMVNGWLMPPTNTKESYQLAKDCGITHFIINDGTGLSYGTQEWENVMNIMNEVGVHGIMSLENSPHSEEYYDGFDQDFSRFPAIKGINYFDEPKTDQDNEWIGNQVSIHEQTYGDDVFFYTNLFPYSVFDRAYDDYVKNFCEDVLKKVSGRRILSMDVYPYYYGDKLIESTWLAGLEVIAKNAKAYDAEMQIWIQSIENLSLGNGSLKMPTEEEFSHQVYTAMAFGAKGYGYFTYASGLASGWGEGLVKKDGTPSESYYWAKALNAEIRAFQNVFLSFDWEKTLAIDGDKAENPCINFMYMDSRPTLDKVNNISATQDALIGQFANGEQKAYMVTNFAEPSFGKPNTVEMAFENANAAVVYSDGGSTVYRLIDGKAVFDIGIGEGIFVIPVNV